jgi:hypothetical protein
MGNSAYICRQITNIINYTTTIYEETTIIRSGNRRS